MASGDIVTNIADKDTLDACYAILQGLKDTTSEGGATKNELSLATAGVGDVLPGKTFYSGDNVLKAGAMTTKGATTYGAKTSDQTIAAGQYLSGDQTIAAVTQSGLVAENILDGVTISIDSNGSNLFSVTGTATSSAGMWYYAGPIGTYARLKMSASMPYTGTVAVEISSTNAGWTNGQPEYATGFGAGTSQDNALANAYDGFKFRYDTSVDVTKGGELWAVSSNASSGHTGDYWRVVAFYTSVSDS